MKDLTWFAPDGTEMTDEQWQAPGVRTLAVQFAGDAIDDRGPRGERIVDDTLLVILNADERPVAFTLPNHAPARRWEVVFDTVHASFTAAHGEHDGGATYRVAERSVVCLRRLPRVRRSRRGMSAADLVPDSYVDAYRKRRTDRARGPRGRAGGDGPRVRRGAAGRRPCRGRAAREASCRSRARSCSRTARGSAGSRRSPPDTPFGYHRLTRDDGSDALLIAGPGRCHLPPGLREWGWAVQLPTTRSRRSWGIGDLGDLRELAAWSRRVGAGFLTVSPLGAPNPTAEPEPSPYFASTRRFGSPLALRAEELPGAIELDELAEAGRALNGGRLVDRRRAIALKMRALERTWAHGGFDRARLRGVARGAGSRARALGHLLRPRRAPRAGLAVLAVDAARPRPVRRSRQVMAEAPHRIAFHAWIQWCFDLQLAAASAEVRRIADMPVGVDPGGFDAWDWQDHAGARRLDRRARRPIQRDRPGLGDAARSSRIGCGRRVTEPFIETIRAQLRHAGGLRIDHVLGLFRLWWVPKGMIDGAYVHYPTDELLEIVAIESHRAGAIVIGEDLGTVPAGVRRELRRRRMLSTRLALFERGPRRPDTRARPSPVSRRMTFRPMAGAVTGSDLDDQAASGVQPDPDGLAKLRARLLAAAGVEEDAGLEEVVLGLHAALAASPSALVAATLEDALRMERRPNLPGTVSAQRPNWSLPLPVPVEDLGGDVRVRSLIRVLGR